VGAVSVNVTLSTFTLSFFRMSMKLFPNKSLPS